MGDAGGYGNRNRAGTRRGGWGEPGTGRVGGTGNRTKEIATETEIELRGKRLSFMS